MNQHCGIIYTSAFKNATTDAAILAYIVNMLKMVLLMWSVV